MHLWLLYEIKQEGLSSAANSRSVCPRNALCTQMLARFRRPPPPLPPGADLWTIPEQSRPLSLCVWPETN
ncbi:hypothetical protein CEXT_155751 [Caerostris extrusa]|uniref:Uncharacterized protein n=1 Tax=Caerostris extrusa TaxID=172846 RepID=A0AAV4T7H9_CAEEX|nr:hypothetical protein CEXT_155751 [Caerostris extrusa]